MASFVISLLSRAWLPGKAFPGWKTISSGFPGYIMIKSVSQSAFGIETEQPVISHIEEFWKSGFYVDALDDLRGVVYLPEAPHALILEAGKVQKLNVQANKLFKLIRETGVGAKGIVK